jgi:translation initiation factor IF-2
MSNMNVTDFANTLKITAVKLLEQFKDAGIPIDDPADLVDDKVKLKLLSYLRSKKSTNAVATTSPKITLNRKLRSQVKLTNSQTGRDRTVSIEVRKKRTFVKPDATLQEVSTPEEASVGLIKPEVTMVPSSAEVPDLIDVSVASDAADVNPDTAPEEISLDDESRKRKNIEAWQASKKEKEDQVVGQKNENERDKKSPKPSGKKKDKTLHIAKGFKARPKGKVVRSRASVTVDQHHGFEKPTAAIVKEIMVPENISVSDLSQMLAIKASDVIRGLMGLGVMSTINQQLDQDTAILVVEELGHKAIPEDIMPRERLIIDSIFIDNPKNLELRHPVVTIMGHVDHGKTSLLDFIRKTKVTDGEAGGITQHIGAYHIEHGEGGITFLDTPGHAAFTAMRARGANVTDIVILVVAADDGVMPQTIEAINHSKAAGVPIIVAINKIDKQDADSEKVKNALSSYEVMPEEWGGESIFVNVSAQTGEGIDLLLESVLLQAELLDLKATYKGPGKGRVVDASIDQGRGPVATILVSSGTINVGDMILAGNESGRIRAIYDDLNNPIMTLTPSMPGVIIGLSGAPMAGDDFLVINDEKSLKEIIKIRHDRERDSRLSKQSIKLEDAFSNFSESKDSILNVLIKADVQGSAEALSEALIALSTDEVSVKIITAGAGGISASDAHLANASSAIIIGFNVRADSAGKLIIKEHDTDVRYYSIIYEAIDDVKLALSGMLPDEVREQIIGNAEVKDIFSSPKFGKIAGSIVIDGVLKKESPIRVLRDSLVIFEGTLESLRRFKDDVSEVKSGTECGIGVKNYDDVKVGDQIECFERTMVKRSL